MLDTLRIRRLNIMRAPHQILADRKEKLKHIQELQERFDTQDAREHERWTVYPQTMHHTPLTLHPTPHVLPLPSRRQ